MSKRKKNKQEKKGVSPLIAGVLYFAIVMAAITIMMTIIMPWMETTKDQISINYAKKNAANLDSIIATVASEGESSSRSMSIDVKRSRFYVDETRNAFYFQYNISTDMVSPRFRINTGNIFFGSQLNSEATDYDSYFLLENQYLRVNISKKGNALSHVSINTSQIINSIYFKEKDIYLDGQNITVIPDNYASSGNGTGYIYLEEEDFFLPKAVVVCRMANANSGISYDLYFELPSDSDFLLIYLKNYSSS
ncbi:MAG: hypothetical protein KAQ92_06280 [Candidatus Aenigmarchaeota archaeon]|nr:hypothetical protein [Candidatus Aenigmarchaeota archaeon]